MYMQGMELIHWNHTTVRQSMAAYHAMEEKTMFHNVLGTRSRTYQHAIMAM
ncbi:hypothetical protein DPMN_035892 [Dreissena polymorpha]|uniref:Uncharacterized protein n=1 Tax=Dreissena polymorpha TaxID=45954 RepID=A0A9D4RNC4_DREPO|nr:hypothetical protein DPMN_035892 [Dreissena polymorpha]